MNLTYLYNLSSVVLNMNIHLYLNYVYALSYIFCITSMYLFLKGGLFWNENLKQKELLFILFFFISF